jgi:hypothetical protein
MVFEQHWNPFPEDNLISVNQPHEDTSMASESHKEKFNQNIKNGNFFDAFVSVIEDAVTLEIITIVEDIGDPDTEINGDKNERTNNKGLPGKRIMTTIGLLEGDIQNVVGSQFISDPAYEKLRTFHETQVAKGETIIQSNLESLHKAMIYLIDIYKKNPNKNTQSNPSTSS